MTGQFINRQRKGIRACDCLKNQNPCLMKILFLLENIAEVHFIYHPIAINEDNPFLLKERITSIKD